MAKYIKHDTKMADMIRTLRQQRGITRAELAEIVGVSESHISKIEAGAKRPGIDTYEKIMYAFQADIEIKFMPETIKGKCIYRIQKIIEKYTDIQVIVMTNIFENISKEIDKL